MAVRTSFTNNTRKAYLECLTRRMKGSKVCGNRLIVPLQQAVDAVLTHFEYYLLNPQVLVRAVEKVLAALAPDPAALHAQRTTLKTQITVTERELANLTTAIASTGSAAHVAGQHQES